MLDQYLSQKRWHPCLLVRSANREEILSQAQKVFCGCGACRTCSRIKQLVYPDFFFVEEESDTIKIEKVRDIISEFQMSPVESEFRLAIFWQAEKLNSSAANALLKSLEEPKPNRYFWLVTPFPKKILPTIRSRSLCFSTQTVTADKEDETLVWNQQALFDQVEACKEKEDFQKIAVFFQKHFRNQFLETRDYRALQSFDDCVQMEYRLQSNTNARLLFENFLRTHF